MTTPGLLPASGKDAATSKLHFSFRDVDLRLELQGLANCGGLKSLLKNPWRCHSEKSEATRNLLFSWTFLESRFLGMTTKGTFSTGR